MYDEAHVTMTQSAACASDVRFALSRSTGKERDAESGNDYFGARYYASAIGRMMSDQMNVSAILHDGDPQEPSASRAGNLVPEQLRNRLILSCKLKKLEVLEKNA